MLSLKCASAGVAGSLSSRRHIGGRARLASNTAPRPELPSSRAALLVRAGGDMGNTTGKLLGEDFGARDPTTGEIESQFGGKSLGEADTEHVVKIPEKIKDLLGLTSKKCVPCEGGTQPLDEVSINRLKNQTPGWKVVKDGEGKFSIEQEWEVKDFSAGLELFSLIGKLADDEGHHPDLHLEGWNKARAVLQTHSIGGLSENDFIVAAKVNEMDFKEHLKPKKQRFWA